MIVGVLAAPSAPLLVAGASATLPADLRRVGEAVDAAVERLPDWDVLVLVGAPEPSAAADERTLAAEPGVYRVQQADLAAVGRAEIRRRVDTPADLAEHLAEAADSPIVADRALPLSLATLALLVGGKEPTVPIAVAPQAAHHELAAVGQGLAAALAALPARVLLVAAADLSAGLDARAPLHEVAGAKEWDATVLDAVDNSRLEVLAKLGPREAERVGALGWAPLAVLDGFSRAAKLGLVRRHYSAPRGVGYLIAQGA